MYYVVKRSSRLSIKIATAREAAKNEGLIEVAQQKMKELVLKM